MPKLYALQFPGKYFLEFVIYVLPTSASSQINHFLVYLFGLIFVCFHLLILHFHWQSIFSSLYNTVKYVTIKTKYHSIFILFLALLFNATTSPHGVYAFMSIYSGNSRQNVNKAN